MAKVFIQESTLTSIGDAIRAKKGTTALIDPAKFATEINSIVAGGGGELEIPAEQLVLTGDQQYRFYKTGWYWYIDKYGKYMSTQGLTYSSQMFAYNSMLTTIPFDLNFASGSCYADYTFAYCTSLVTPPKMNVSGTFTSSFTLANLFNKCSAMRNADRVFDPDALEAGLSSFVATSATSVPKFNSLFYNCSSLEHLPPWFSKLKLSSNSTVYPSSSYALYSSTFYNCYSLDEVVDMPVFRVTDSSTAAVTSNYFGNTLKACYRLKNFTFETDNGAPFAVRWKSQTIDLSDVGVGNPSGFNSVTFGTHNHVTDDATYHALKNDPNWWTNVFNYSRFNHDSAVATINSLPDTSAYLTAAGGTNTIKFKGNAGAKTDGGAINTLTEEEIAVATAKGWTVTLV